MKRFDDTAGALLRDSDGSLYRDIKAACARGDAVFLSEIPGTSPVILEARGDPLKVRDIPAPPAEAETKP